MLKLGTEYKHDEIDCINFIRTGYGFADAYACFFFMYEVLKMKKQKVRIEAWVLPETAEKLEKAAFETPPHDKEIGDIIDNLAAEGCKGCICQSCGKNVGKYGIEEVAEGDWCFNCADCPDDGEKKIFCRHYSVSPVWIEKQNTKVRRMQNIEAHNRRKAFKKIEGEENHGAE